MITKTTTSPPAVAGAAAPMRPGRSRRRRTIVQVVGSVVVAAGVALVARSVFGLSSLLAVVFVAYVGFVVTVALAEIGSAREPDDVIDLRFDDDPDGTRAEPLPALRAVAEYDESLDVPRRRRRIDPGDLVEFGVAAMAAVAFAELLRVVLRMRSLVGVSFWGYIAFIAFYFLLTRDRHHAEAAVDRVVTVVVWSVGVFVAAALSWMLVYVTIKGYSKLSMSFFTEDLSKTGPLTPGGGAKHAIIGTLEQVGLATLFVVPTGILTAVYLHEVQGRLARPVRFITDAMSGLPSIVAGLIVFTIVVPTYGFSGMAAAIALSILMLPTMTRASEEILRTVPDQLREGALALGAPQWRVVQRVVLPTALAGLTTAALLSVARAIGETAPLLLTAFGSDRTNTNPFHGPQSALPLFIFKLIRQPNQTQIDRAFTGAFVLITLVLILFVAARAVAGRGRKRLEGSR